MAKIIIIDDSETLRSQVRKALESAGHQIVEAVDGLDGFAKITENTDAKLVLCDVNMPNMDGLSMCQKVSKTPSLKAPPIFMLTTEANPEMKAKGKEAGVLAWITKPFDEKKLLSAVEKIVTRVAVAA